MQQRSQNIFSIFSILLTLGILAVPLFLFAHSEGVSFEKEVANFIIDIGYEPAEPAANSPIYFDFNLFERPTGSVDFSRVWVRIEKDGAVYLAGGIAKPSIGPTTLTTQLPEGNYELSVRYEDPEGKTLVESTFPLTVAASEEDTEDSGFSGFLVAGLFGIILGAVLMRMFKR